MGIKKAEFKNDELGKSISFKCDKCETVIIVRPKYHKDADNWYFSPYCDEHIKDDLDKLVIEYTPEEYNIRMALQKNIELGTLKKIWDDDIKDWTFQVTGKGKKDVNNMGK